MPDIALQLYTVRDAMSEDLHRTLRRVRDCGFEWVETAFFPEGIDCVAARDALDAAGLRVRSAHLPLPTASNIADLETFARTLGTEDVVWHGWPRDERHNDTLGVDSLLEAYRVAHGLASSRGLRLHLHNHWWEFEQPGKITTYSRIVAETPPEIGLELDTYWTLVAGEDPVEWVRRAGSRMTLLHIKDGPGIPNAPKLPVGQGVLPVGSICALARRDATWVVELDDCAGDIFDAIRTSRERLERELPND